MTFREALADGPLLLDGATGTELIAIGCPTDRPPAIWSIERPDDVRRVVTASVEAGARVVMTNTFCAAPAFVGPWGVDSSDVISRSIDIACDAAGGRAFVAGSISVVSPDGPHGTVGYAEYRRQSELFCSGGVDAIVIETMTSIDELRTAVLGASAVREGTPLVACMSFGADLRTIDGTLPEEMAWVLEDLGADAVGVNCCDGPETVLRVVEALARATDLPIWAKPNAGLPGALVDDDAFAAFAVRIVGAGADAIGGCCGTTPQTIRAIGKRLGLDDPCA